MLPGTSPNNRWSFLRASVACGTGALLLAVTGCTASPAPDDSGSAVPSGDASPRPTGSPDSSVVVGEVSPGRARAMAPSKDEAAQLGIPKESLRTTIDTGSNLPWQLIRTAGVVQAVACTGSGNPTIVYSADLDTAAAWSWARVVAEQSTTNRICVLDRAGTGFSPRRSEAAEPNGPVANAKELIAAMDAMGEKDPYVLVGAGYGGLVARAAAALKPGKIAGLMLVDATGPTDYRGSDQAWSEAGSELDMEAAEELVGDGPNMGDKPVVVLRPGRPTGGESASELRTRSAQLAEAAKISRNGLVATVTKSDSAIAQRNPAAVIAATNQMISAIVTGQKLATCPAEMADTGVDC